MNTSHSYPFRKSALATALGLSLCSGHATAVDWIFSGTFTHYDSAGNPSGHVDTLVNGIFDLSAGTGSFNSGIPFQANNWVADVDAMFFYDTNTGGTQNFTYTWHNKQIFTGSAVVNCRTGAVNLDGCAGIAGSVLVDNTNSYTFSMTNASQFAAGMFFDWSVNLDIPVLAVMEGQDDPSDGQFAVISLDSDGDGVPGTAMLTAPFPGHTADFQGTLTLAACSYTVVPPPPVTGKSVSGTGQGQVDLGTAQVIDLNTGNPLPASEITAVRESDMVALDSTPGALNTLFTGEDRVIWDKLNTTEAGCEGFQTAVMHEWDPPAAVSVTTDFPADPNLLGTPTDLGSAADYPNGTGLVFSNDAPAGGYAFSLTPYTVTWTATDDLGGTTTATQQAEFKLFPGLAGAPCSIDLATAGDRLVDAVFTMRTPTGSVSGNVDHTVQGMIDTTALCPDESCTVSGAALATSQPFFGDLWTATPIRLFGPGSYSFDPCPGGSDPSTFCTPTTPNVGMTVKDAASNGGVPQLGAHMLFDYSVNKAIDVVVVWDVDCGAAMLTTTDPDGDGILGTSMADGPFIGFNAAFDLITQPGEPPIAQGGFEVAVPAYQSPVSGGSPRLLNPTILTASDLATDGSVVASCLLDGCFQFSVSGVTGSSLNLVFPLNNPIPFNAVLRKFINGSWRDFVVDANNSIKTATLIAASGLCPEPGSANYTAPPSNSLIPGVLTPGHQCLQITVQDNGPNDSDPTVGVVADPFSISEVMPVVDLDPSSSGGGCSIGQAQVRPAQRADWLLLLGFLVLVGGYGARRRLH